MPADDLDDFGAERLHPMVTNWRCRPKPAGQVAPKPPGGEPSPYLFRFYEAAVRDLTDPARSGY